MAQPPKTSPDRKETNAYRAAFDQATQIASATETMERCAEVERAMESLRIRYEQYFLGLSRQPPADDHALVRSAVLHLRQGFVRNTSARFRVQSIHNRFLAYERLWQRTCREIEEGTYRRDLLKLRRKSQAQSPDDSKAAEELAAFREKQASTSDAAAAPSEPGKPEAVAEGGPPLPRAAALRDPPAPARAAGPALQEEKLRKLYDAYVGAKRRCRENTDGLTFESMAASLRKQVPELLQQHNASAVDFKVVISGGKAVLKAVPR